MKKETIHSENVTEHNKKLRHDYPFVDKPNLIIIPKGVNKEDYLKNCNEARKQYLIRNDPKMLEYYIKRWHDEFGK